LFDDMSLLILPARRTGHQESHNDWTTTGGSPQLDLEPR
jgi:hypothetical protein